MTLLDLKQGEKALILRVHGREAFRRRLMEMGFVVGKEITVVKKAPFKGPVEYEIIGTRLALRNHEAAMVEVCKERENKQVEAERYRGTVNNEPLKYFNGKCKTNINVAIVGNPNSGKTSLFNQLTRSRERVGNYGGVTLAAKTATLNFKGYSINFIDLPGSYSLGNMNENSHDIRNYLFEEIPDIVINVVEAPQIERNLYLTTDLIDFDTKAIVVLNMYDELEKSGHKLDYQELGKLTGIPFVPMVSLTGKGVSELLNTIIELYEDKNPVARHIHIHYGESVEKAIHAIQDEIRIEPNRHLTDLVSSRFLAVKLLEKDQVSKERLQVLANASEIIDTAGRQIAKLEKLYNDSSESIITNAKYGFISGALHETLQHPDTEKRKTSEIIDSFLTHKLFGLPVFLLFIFIMFWATFSLGQYPMHWIEAGVSALSAFSDRVIADGIFKDLFIDGILSGVGGVIVYLPNILILFFCISLMEDTGYMSRAVFMMDNLMHKIGLHGKSFIPLMMGFGCNVPAIISARMLENKNERLRTILINSFISCNARLPVYLLLISAFFPKHSAIVLFLVYMAGIMLAVFTAILLKKSLHKSEETPFVMELPPYRMPPHRIILDHMWDKAWLYIKKIGGVILIASVIFWALSYFPINIKYSKDYESLSSELATQYNHKISSAGINTNLQEKLNEKLQFKLEQLELERKSEQKEKSYLGEIGHFIEPVIAPLGFDWKVGISIISGIAAKEIIVSTLAVLYQAEKIEEPETGKNKTTGLVDKLRNATYQLGPKQGRKVFDPLIAFALMIFVSLYFPCIGTIAVIVRETGSWKWGAFSVIYTLAVAWTVAFAIYQAGRLLF